MKNNKNNRLNRTNQAVRRDESYQKSKFDKMATNDAKVIEQWLKECPNVTSFAVPTGKVSGLFAIEIEADRSRLQYGDLSADILRKKYGEFPETLTIKAGDEATILVFAYPRGLSIPTTQNKLGIDINVCGDEGFFIMAGSVVNKIQYDFVDTSIEPALPPIWLIELITGTEV
jgi:hypothetical protein